MGQGDQVDFGPGGRGGGDGLPLLYEFWIGHTHTFNGEFQVQ